MGRRDEGGLVHSPLALERITFILFVPLIRIGWPGEKGERVSWEVRIYFKVFVLFHGFNLF